MFLNLFWNAPKPGQFLLQDAGVDFMEELLDFHDDVMFFLVLIVFAIFYLLIMLVKHFFFYKEDPEVDSYMRDYRVVHNTKLEVMWTFLPAIILLSIVLPSFALIYMSIGRLNAMSPMLVMKVVGHQWYWTYEYMDSLGNSSSLDSYLVPSNELNAGNFRLFEVTDRLTMPIDTRVRFLVTSVDVMHSWAVPGLGIKLDACPGRLNEAMVRASSPGVYMGQCSEMCGSNHGFMPIMVDVVSPSEFYAVYSDTVEEEDEEENTSVGLVE